MAKAEATESSWRKARNTESAAKKTAGCKYRWRGETKYNSG
jgi:hypothetical protein